MSWCTHSAHTQHTTRTTACRAVHVVLEEGEHANMTRSSVTGVTRTQAGKQKRKSGKKVCPEGADCKYQHGELAHMHSQPMHGAQIVVQVASTCGMFVSLVHVLST